MKKVLLTYIFWVLAIIFIDITETIIFHPDSWIIINDWIKDYWSYTWLGGDGWHLFKQLYLLMFALFPLFLSIRMIKLSIIKMDIRYNYEKDTIIWHVSDNIRLPGKVLIVGHIILIIFISWGVHKIMFSWFLK